MKNLIDKRIELFNSEITILKGNKEIIGKYKQVVIFHQVLPDKAKELAKKMELDEPEAIMIDHDCDCVAYFFEE